MGGRVTVVIPTRNRCQLLVRTLGTVFAQDDEDVDVVVDDGSTDPTPRALAGLRQDRLTVVRHERARGVSAARNAGIAAARTEWVAFVDDDDIWSPAKIRAQLDVAKAHPETGWICTGAVRVDAQLRLGGPERAPTTPDVLAGLFCGNVIPGGASSVLAQTRLVRAAGGFDSSLSNLADYDLWIRLAMASPLGAVDRPLVGYRVHTGGMAHNVGRSERELLQIEGQVPADPLRAEHQYIAGRLSVVLRLDVSETGTTHTSDTDTP